jgi:hypothetical protein
MRVTIITVDGMVGINGEFRKVAGLTAMFPGVRAIQWGEQADAGHVEFLDGSPNSDQLKLADLQPAIDAWHALTPPPPSDAELLAEAKLVRTAGINTACAAEITGGFVSNALGTPHTYDSDDTDQLNLIGAAGTGVDTLYKCTDAAGFKDFRLHTAAQIKQVLEDGAMVKLLALQKAAVLKAQVAAAGTVVEVEAVVW